MKRLYQDNVLREIINSIADAFVVIDKDGNICEWNKKAFDLFGWEYSEVVGRPFAKIANLNAADTQKLRSSDRSLVPVRNDFTIITKYGANIPVEVTSLGVTLDGGDRFVVSTFRNLCRERAEQDSLRRRAELLNLSRDGIFVVDNNQRVIFWNKGAERMYGFTEDEALGQPVCELLKIDFDSISGKSPTLQIALSLIDSHEWEGELQQYTKDCREITVLSRWAVDVAKEEVMITNTDITDLKEHTMRAEYLATHDHLTGLPNRRLFDDRIAHAITQSKRYSTKFALILLDLDRFKYINDSLGHHKGDLMLKAIGSRLKALIREEDTIARLGGDEFVILMENIHDESDIHEVVEKIIKEVEAPVDVDGMSLMTRASVGISIFPANGVDPQTLLRNADMAMYRAKEIDKGSFRFYSSEMHDKVQKRINDETLLVHALENHEFELFYQPKICADEERPRYKMVGVEALIRWNHPTRGLVMPSDFIALAEENGLISPIGEWVIQEACKQCMEWQKCCGDEIRMSVNLSLQQLQRGKSIIQVINESLVKSGLHPGLLDIEITESMAMSNADVMIDVLRQIRALGVSLSIDDFGTGYSSLAYLKRMPLDNIKIDQSFIRGIPDQNDICIVRAIIAMAHSLGLKVIAEGVSRKQQVSILDTMQCDEMQGFLFSKPMCATQIQKNFLGRYWELDKMID